MASVLVGLHSYSDVVGIERSMSAKHASKHSGIRYKYTMMWTTLLAPLVVP